MTAIAQSAVLVPSSADIDLDDFSHKVRASDSGKPADTAGSPARPHKPQPAVRGPSGDLNNVEKLLACYPTLGFQGTHFGQAVALGKKMLTKQPPSTIFIIQDGEFVKVEPDAEQEETEVFPNIFLGITATLMGTGCREAVRFLVQEGIAPRTADDIAAAQGNLSLNEINFPYLKRNFGNYAAQHFLLLDASTLDANDCMPVGAYKSFLSAVVMAGGGPEHDLRRACQTYHVGHYASEMPAAGTQAKKQHRTAATQDGAAAAAEGHARFGNVLYASSARPTSSSSVCSSSSRVAAAVAAKLGKKSKSLDAHAESALFDTVLQKFVELLCERQRALERTEAEKPAQAKQNALLDGTAYCSWSVTPSEVWALAGLWLEDLFVSALTELDAAKLAKTAKKRNKTAKKPLACRGAADVRAEAAERARSTVLYWAARQEVPLFCPSFADGDLARLLADQQSILKLDLVRDIHGINKLAMYSKRTGMLICGGGSVKHHVCNANLMRNGADYTVFISNGQEFDGSDAGARPEEAVSWGKIRCDGEAVKVYSEVSVVLPLLVAQVFVPAVREREAGS